jgi:hypothetical protein
MDAVNIAVIKQLHVVCGRSDGDRARAQKLDCVFLRHCEHLLHCLSFADAVHLDDITWVGLKEHD